MEGIRIKNFRVLKDVALGLSGKAEKPLTPLTVAIGKNGAGKSTLYDAFRFLHDCLSLGVEKACNTERRGGYEKLVSQGQGGPIELEVTYREDPRANSITYKLAIDLDASGRPYVSRERLLEERGGRNGDEPLYYLALNNGEGEARASEESHETEEVDLDDNRKLGIATLGGLKRHPTISAFRKFIEGWHLSDFAPDAAKRLVRPMSQKHLGRHGDNLGNVVKYMENEHAERFRKMLGRFAERVPGIDKVGTRPTDDDRLLLYFNDSSFEAPFPASQMSDGTLKVFAYMLLMEDPNPAPFLCIEEPESGLYHKLLEILVAEFRRHADRKDGPQVFVTTHQPYLVDALGPEEVWTLEKGLDGFATARRASDDELVKNMAAEGLPLGGLWYSDYLEAR
jgi:predicted ATPase